MSAIPLPEAFEAFDKMVVSLRTKIDEDKSIDRSTKSTCVAFLDKIQKEKNEIQENEKKLQSQKHLSNSLKFLEKDLKPLREKAEQLARLPEENKKLAQRLQKLKEENRKLKLLHTPPIIKMLGNFLN